MRHSHHTLAVLCALCALAVPARADTIDVTATTLLAGRPDPRDGEIHTMVPILESIQATATDIKSAYVRDLHAVLSLWGEVDPGDPRRDDAATGDIDVGYIEGRIGCVCVGVRAGRQLVQGGAARNLQLDGVNIEGRRHGLGLQAYGGVPVTPRFAVDRGDGALGGRLSYRRSFETEVGVSFLHLSDNGRIARQDVALDGRWAPRRQFTLSAYGLWSIYEARLAEIDTRAYFMPSKKVELSVDYRRTAPDLFISRTSIFAVFSDENRDEVGGYLMLEPRPRIRFYGDYHGISQSEGTGHRAGSKLTLTAGQAYDTTIGLEGRLLKLADDGYYEARAFGSHRFAGGTFFTLDGDSYFLDQPLNGKKWSLTGQATVGRDFHSWRAVIAGLAGVTPFAERRFEVMARLAYSFTTHFREVHK